MTPTEFPEQTRALAAPPNWDYVANGPCASLPIWHERGRFISRWRPTWRERVAILFGAPVWLTVVSSFGHPPVSLHAIRRMFTPAQVALAAEDARQRRPAVEDGSEIIARARD